MSEQLQKITDSRFEADVLKADLPVLVDFWAPWCGPCKAVAPVVEKLAARYAGRMLFYKCNVDDNPATPGKFGVRSIPTLILFKGGKVVDQVVGAGGGGKIEKAIESLLNGGAPSSPFVVH